ncbi:TonB-dependent receptor family protein [Novosphingobium aquimarinum]|uniref:TonB-dependent receptor family protein n=1 Tax=Novosphingobium aquimarinum TaxID=2682494 RepID=UPI0012EB83BA|nr:TonB-dependent receptor [Novosphingobium aquimarinum]
MLRPFVTLALAACAISPALAEDAESDPTIIVTAERQADDPPAVAAARERLARTPGSVSVVASESYEDRFVIGLPDLLRDVPGVLANTRYGEEARLSIRGSGLDQSYHQRGVLLAQDGVPFADADGFSDFQKIDPLGARYIEVYKGGNALRFGGAQLGGAINLVTPSGRNVASPFALRLEGGSFDSVRGQGHGAGTAGKFDWYGGVNATRSDGYRQNSRSDQVRGTINLGYALGDDSEIRVIGYAADINQQVPGAVSLETALTNPRYAGDGVILRRQARDQSVYRGSVQTRLRLTDGLVFEGGIYATQTDLYHPVGIFILQDTDTQGAFGRFDLAGELAGHRADVFFGAYYREGGSNQTLALNLAGNQGATIGDSVQQADALDVFAEGRFFVVPELAVVAGGSWGRARRDYANTLGGTQADRTYDWFAPRLGLLYEHGSVQVYANYTKSVEPPHFSALTQTNTAGSVFVPLHPQRAWTAEIGTRGKLAGVTWDVTYYRAQVRGELLSFLPDANLPASVFNADKTLHQGVEASLDIALIDTDAARLRLRQTYAWSDFRFRDEPAYDNNRLPVAPRHQYRASLRFEGGGGFYIEPFVDWRFEDVFVDYANTLKAPGYALFNLSAGFDLGPVTIYADGRNLTDKRYAAEFAAVTDARVANTAVFFPGQGRTVFGGLRFAF